LVTARAWIDESVALSRQHGDQYQLAYAESSFMFLEVVAGQPVPRARREETLRLARASGNPWIVALATQDVARAAWISGDLAQAEAGFEASIALFQELGDRHFTNGSRSEIGHVWRQEGRFAEAAARYRETLPVWQELGQRAAVAHQLECLAFIAIDAGQAQRAARLLGAAEALREVIGSEMTRMERHEYERAVARLRALPDEVAVTAAWASGRALSLDEAVQFALDNEVC